MQKIKVLIIDNELEFMSILTDRLCSWGFAATSAANREEVLEALTSARPEVVVLGLRGRDSQALDTLRMIKTIDPSIEVILLIGKGAAIAGMQGMEQGAFDCIAHPIELGVLIEKIKQGAEVALNR